MTETMPVDAEPDGDNLWAPEEAEWDQLVEGLSHPEPADFWNSRRVLTHIRDFARARRVAPWAVLGGVLTRVVACCPPAAQLPSIIGSYASINLFVGLVGPSGAGKDAANKVARDALDLGEHEAFKTAPIGSGEGLSHMFMRLTKDGELEQHNEAALVTVGEIDTLTALVKRQSSTVGSQLRQAAMGESLGFFYVDTSKRMIVPEHRYRLCLVAGIQPKRAGALLGEADGGTPQRFVWLPATDPDAPDVRPPCPAPMVWVPPVWHEIGGGWTGGMYRNVIDVCEQAVEVIDSAHLARTRGQGGALDGHALLTRLKVATGLAVLEGRAEVTDEDWDLSAEVMAVSDETRERVRKVLAEETHRENRVQAEAEAVRTIVVQERVDAAAVQRACGTIRRTLAKAGGEGTTRAGLNRALTGAPRLHLDAALNALVLSGEVVEAPTEYRGQPGMRYHLAEQGSMAA